ncbi:MAG: sulfite exporter TauE/SafE family protein [Aquabacterium sp.]
MGLGGMPHCATMCGAPCAVVFPRGLPLTSLLGRCAAYAALGVIAAVSAGAVAAWGRQVAFLRPLWMLLLLAAIVLGLYLLRSGDMPRRVNDWGLHLYRRARVRWGNGASKPSDPRAKLFWPFLGGLAWAIMPCGLLYAALMVAALAPTAWGGGLVMLVFALPGAAAVWAAPVLLRWISRLRPAKPGMGPGPSPAVKGTLGASAAVPVIWMKVAQAGNPAAQACDAGRDQASDVAAPAAAVFPSGADTRWAVRLSGLMLAVMSAWALYHQLWSQWQAWCA